VKVSRFKTGLLIVLVLCLAFVSLFASCATASSQKVTLSLVSGWSDPDQFNVMLHKWVDGLNASSSIVNIDFKGGVEIVPPLQGLDYVRKGTVDLWSTTATYYGGSVPAAMALNNMVASQAAMRQSGFWDLVDQMHREKAGVADLGQMARGDPFAMFLNKPITKADFTGLKLRSVPMYDEFIKSLGGSPVTLGGEEIYSGMQTGVVDGFAYPYGPGFVDKKWYEVTKYVVKPLIPFESQASLLISASKWDGLADNIRKEIMDSIIKIEPDVYKYFKGESQRATNEMVAAGKIKEIILSGADADKYLAAAKDGLWNTVTRGDPKWGPQLKTAALKAEEIQRKMQ
jgi:TRAP-type C4-dicarboxylate transport system substrate-binding protein